MASDEISIVFVIPTGGASTLTWARRIEQGLKERKYPSVLLHDSSLTEELPALTDLLQPTSLTELPSGYEDRRHTYNAVFSQLTTRYFAIVQPSKSPRAFEILERQLFDSREIVSQLDSSGTWFSADPTPLLLFTRQPDREPVRAYLKELSRLVTPPASLGAYYGYLALQCGSHTLEAVDPSENRLLFQARSSLGRNQLIDLPEWQFRIILESAQGEALAQSIPSFSKRINSQGEQSWENLTGALDLSRVPSGDYRLRIALNTGYDAIDRRRRSLRPSTGLLASARSVEGGISLRYIVHTTGTGRDSWITVNRGEGNAGAKAWKRSLARKDLAQLVRASGVLRLRLARIFRLITHPLMQNKEIWLVGEREDTAQDNGMHLFRHLRREYPQRSVYYIIDNDSPQMSRVAELGNVVSHSSLKHRFLMLHAQVIANSYSIKHMTPRQWSPDAYTRVLAWRVGALRVYLKHGVHMATNSVKRGKGGYDLYLTVSAKETAALRESSGYDKQLVETGLPRYDALIPTKKSREVLFMPTWRRYLVPKLFGNGEEARVEFEGSTYERFLSSFLSSPRLREILEHYDYTLKFLPHYNVRELLRELPIEQTRVSFADTENLSFTDLLTRCDVFITDYSSVHFDVAYVGTPIIYTQFDRDEYLSGHASVSWFDYDRDGFGPVATNVSETLDALETVLDQNCAPDPRYAERINAAFTFRDHNNNARVVRAIDALLTKRFSSQRGLLR